MVAVVCCVYQEKKYNQLSRCFGGGRICSIALTFNAYKTLPVSVRTNKTKANRNYFSRYFCIK